MSSAPNPASSRDDSSAGESPNHSSANEPADDADDTRSTLRTALGALRARLSPVPEADNSTDD